MTPGESGNFSKTSGKLAGFEPVSLAVIAKSAAMGSRHVQAVSNEAIPSYVVCRLLQDKSQDLRVQGQVQAVDLT